MKGDYCDYHPIVTNKLNLNKYINFSYLVHLKHDLHFIDLN